MADFGPAIAATLKNEGAAFVQNSKTGEVSKYGVSLATYKSLVNPQATAATIENLTVDEASAFYEHWFWNQLGGPWLAFQTLANKVFDIGFNPGAGTAARELQGAINDCGGNVTVDGIVGPNTIAAANTLAPGPLLDAFKARVVQRYREIAADDPNHAGDLAGWLARANS